MLDSPDPRFRRGHREGARGCEEEQHRLWPDGGQCGKRLGSATTQGFSMISLAAEARILSVAAQQAVKEIKAGR